MHEWVFLPLMLKIKILCYTIADSRHYKFKEELVEVTHGLKNALDGEFHFDGLWSFYQNKDELDVYKADPNPFMLIKEEGKLIDVYTSCNLVAEFKKDGERIKQLIQKNCHLRNTKYNPPPIKKVYNLRRIKKFRPLELK